MNMLVPNQVYTISLSHKKSQKLPLTYHRDCRFWDFLELFLFFNIAQREFIFLSNKIFLMFVCVKHHVGTGIKKIQP